VQHPDAPKAPARPAEAGADSPELVDALRRATEAVAALGIDPARWCVDGVRDGAWCLTRDADRWLVFTQDGVRRKGAEFNTVHEAIDFFVGHLYLRRDEYRPSA